MIQTLFLYMAWGSSKGSAISSCSFIFRHELRTGFCTICITASCLTPRSMPRRTSAPSSPNQSLSLLRMFRTMHHPFRCNAGCRLPMPNDAGKRHASARPLRKLLPMLMSKGCCTATSSRATFLLTKTSVLGSTISVWHVRWNRATDSHRAGRWYPALSSPRTLLG